VASTKLDDKSEPAWFQALSKSSGGTRMRSLTSPSKSLQICLTPSTRASASETACACDANWRKRRARANIELGGGPVGGWTLAAGGGERTIAASVPSERRRVGDALGFRIKFTCEFSEFSKSNRGGNRGKREAGNWDAVGITWDGDWNEGCCERNKTVVSMEPDAAKGVPKPKPTTPPGYLLSTAALSPGWIRPEAAPCALSRELPASAAPGRKGSRAFSLLRCEGACCGSCACDCVTCCVPLSSRTGAPKTL
jgi:hypothetical protein